MSCPCGRKCELVPAPVSRLEQARGAVLVNGNFAYELLPLCEARRAWAGERVKPIKEIASS